MRRAVALFCIEAALANNTEAITSLHQKALEGAGDLTGGQAASESGDHDAEIVVQARRVLARNDLDPQEIAIVGLRFVDAILSSDFKQHLAGDLARWLRANWSRIIGEQRFRLRQPMATVPPIEVVLGDLVNDASFCARLALLGVDAVGVPIATEFRAALNAWSVRKQGRATIE